MQNPPLDELNQRSYPQLAAAVLAAKAAVLQEWRRRVVETLPGADELTLRQLDDTLPKLLDLCAEALGSASAPDVERLLADSPSHGSTRFHQHFNLNELLVEYHLLRRCMIEQVAMQLGRPMATGEVVALNTCLDVIGRRAVVAFADHQSEQIRAEAAAMAKYLSFLSHDLRGGLNAAILTAEVLKRDLADEPRLAGSLEDLDTMRRAMLDTVATMERFLHAERLRRGKVPIRIEEIDLAALFEEQRRRCAPQLSEGRMNLIVRIEGPAVIRSDRELLATILSNLLGNAIKYGRGGDVHLLAAPLAAPHAGGTRLSVIDHGPGISKERLATLFTPFTRGETHGQSGSGLGLSIAHQAAQLLKANLWAESQIGHGASFHLDLPPDAPAP